MPLLATVAFFCYLYAPIAYELTGDQLTVRFRMGQKVFPAVTGCATLTARPPMGLRLWGNGGLFAATGIFWNKAYGVYRAYVTSARYQDYVLVETRTQKILISPENPEEFVRTWASSAPVAPAPANRAHPAPKLRWGTKNARGGFYTALHSKSYLL